MIPIVIDDQITQGMAMPLSRFPEIIRIFTCLKWFFPPNMAIVHLMGMSFEKFLGVKKFEM